MAGSGDSVALSAMVWNPWVAGTWAVEALGVSGVWADLVSIVVAGAVVLGVGTGLFLLTLLVTACARRGGAVGPSLLEFALSVLRAWTALWLPVKVSREEYPTALTCQIPWFNDLSKVYRFIWGWKRDGVFVEVGAFDGDSFSNTSCLADIGWTGHYVEPIPAFAAECRRRHAAAVSAGRVHVHEYAVSDAASAGQTIELSPAGPFSSSVEEEAEAFSSDPIAGPMQFLGWGHTPGPKVSATTKALNDILRDDCGIAPLSKSSSSTSSSSSSKRGRKSPAKKGNSRSRSAARSRSDSDASVDDAPAGTITSGCPPAADHATKGISAWSEWADTLIADRDAGHVSFNMNLMIVDIEGMEWPVLSSLDLGAFRPEVIIVEIQEKLRRYRDSPKVLAEAAAIERLLDAAGYSILYRDVINTVFVHRAVRCHGED